jgi:hypothetical protein
MVASFPGIANQPPALTLATILRVTQSLVESYGPRIHGCDSLQEIERSLQLTIDELEQIAANEGQFVRRGTFQGD